jgi:hypothetical protein
VKRALYSSVHICSIAFLFLSGLSPRARTGSASSIAVHEEFSAGLDDESSSSAEPIVQLESRRSRSSGVRVLRIRKRVYLGYGNHELASGR